MWNMKSERRLKLNAAIAATLLSIWNVAGANTSSEIQVETFPVIPQSSSNEANFTSRQLSPMAPLENNRKIVDENVIQPQKNKKIEAPTKIKGQEISLEDQKMRQLFAERERERIADEKREMREQVTKKKQAEESVKKKVLTDKKTIKLGTKKAEAVKPKKSIEKKEIQNKKSSNSDDTKKKTKDKSKSKEVKKK